MVLKQITDAKLVRNRTQAKMTAVAAGRDAQTLGPRTVAASSGRFRRKRLRCRRPQRRPPLPLHALAPLHLAE